MQIVPVTRELLPYLRDLRFRALYDAPDSFGPTYEWTLAQPDSYWEAWASGRGGRVQAFVAIQDGIGAGLVSGGVASDGVGHWGALWVAPQARGTGVGSELVETICGWLEVKGCTRIELEVTEGNPAERLYESLGFARTGARKPLREGSPLFEVTMAKTLEPQRREGRKGPAKS